MTNCTIRKFVLPALIAASLLARAGAQSVPEIGGQKIVTLTRAAVSTTHPEFTRVTVLPGRGMEILYLTANFPGKGNVNVFSSPDLAGCPTSRF